MNEPPKDPTNRELLERIVRLEAENAHLTARCNDLLEAFKSHVDGNVHEFDRIGDLLWAVAHKVFPNLSEMLGKMNAVIPPRYVSPSIDRRPGEYKRD
jgi:hypothetical protein